MIVLDASVIIAMLDPTDALHAEATTLMAEQAESKFLVHHITLAEVLVGAVRQGHAGQRLADLAAAGIRAAEPDAQEPLLLAELRATTGLRLPDCCVLVVAIRTSSVLVSFDARLRRAARALDLQVLPAA